MLPKGIKKKSTVKLWHYNSTCCLPSFNIRRVLDKVPSHPSVPFSFSLFWSVVQYFQEWHASYSQLLVVSSFIPESINPSTIFSHSLTSCGPVKGLNIPFAIFSNRTCLMISWWTFSLLPSSKCCFKPQYLMPLLQFSCIQHFFLYLSPFRVPPAKLTLAGPL
jgi:hypothetical protein